MSNVPHGVRSRHGGTKSRSTHSPDLYQPSPGGASAAALVEETSRQQVTTQDISPGSIGSGAFQEGALDLSSFASTLRPVHIVAALPALPDTDYPVGSVAVLTTDGKLYRNDADAWTAVVDADDIVATSIVAGAVTAGAISVEEIIVHDGKLTFSDQFGSTVLDGYGFSDAWRRFISSGVYNGDFSAGSTSDIAASEVSGGDTDLDYQNSISADLPYWVVDDKTNCTIRCLSDASAPSGRALQFDLTGNGSGTAYQDIPVVPGQRYILHRAVKVDRDSFDLSMPTFAAWHDATHGPISTESLDALTFTSDVTSYTSFERKTGPAPANARYLRIYIGASASGTGRIAYSSVMVERVSDEGTSFPTKPDALQKFWRTDLHLEFFYDGVRWLSTNLYEAGSAGGQTAFLAATTTGINRTPWPAIKASGVTTFYIEKAVVTAFILGGGTALSASHKWTVTWRYFTVTGAVGTLGQMEIDSGAADVWKRIRDDAIDVIATPGSSFGHEIEVVKTGTPGNIIVLGVTYNYRLIGN